MPLEPPCAEFDEVFVWADADGDGFGADEPIGYVCAVGDGEATNNADCDDTDETINPTGVEVCDLKDNDCNNRVDETEPKIPWYHDADADGFGSNVDILFACLNPGDEWLETSGDCDDTLATVNPLMVEICNEGIDDDCDTLADDADGGVDSNSYLKWYRDLDGDGYGDAEHMRLRCAAPPSSVADDQDCDDDDAAISPLAFEVCDEIDNDCDGLTDDLDDSIDPATQQQFFADTDGDGYGDANTLTLACDEIPGIGVMNDDDCDDTDPLAYVEQWWGLDTDGDGAGDGQELVYQCLNPGAGMGPEGSGIDCEPSDPNIFPLQLEDCFDGIDQNCNADLDCADSDCTGVVGCDYIQDFESGTIPPEFTMGGNSIFTAVGGAAQEGNYRAVSGNISDNQDVWMEIQLDYAAAGTISFWHSGSTEANWDYLRFTIDGVEIYNKSGTWGWTYSEFNVNTAGVHTFRWRYDKDVSVSGGTDDIGIDYIYASGGTL